MSTILVGADPEVFVKDRQGRFRSAHGLIPGTKKEPHKVNDGAVQVDGMALEYNINPASTAEEFVAFNKSVIAQMAAMVPDYQIVIEPTAIFHGNHMRVQPKEALELGCEPDYNAYTKGENKKPDNTSNMRTAAGHVHIGFCEGADPQSPEHIQRCATLVKHLDLFLGLPSLLWDADTKRRSMYGAAGCFRAKSYGVEYRTMSNMWLNSEELMAYVFRQVILCVENLKKGYKPQEDVYYRVQRAINTSNLNEAVLLMEDWGIAVPDSLHDKYFPDPEYNEYDEYDEDYDPYDDEELDIAA